jgi:hypothetical protein
VPDDPDRLDSILLLHRDNKSQQKSTTRGRGFLAEATNINRNQQKSTESAKVSKISPGRRVQSAKVSKSHQQSSEIITGLDRSHQKSSIIIRNHQKSALVGLVCKRLQFFFDQTGAIGT